MIDCVVNYYCKDRSFCLVRSSAQLSLSCLRGDPLVGSIFLVDGSPTSDPELSLWCDQLGIAYLHAGRALSFAEGFNLGIAQCRAAWIALLASDIYVPLGFFSQVFKVVESLDPANIGCLIPALTFSDIPSQERYTSRLRHSSMMSLNLNIFPARHLSLIGGVPEQYSGAYNDIEMVIRLRRLCLPIYQLPLKVLHYGKLTISQGTDYHYDFDHSRFFEVYPALFSPNSLCNLKLDHFMTGWRRVLFFLERRLPFGRYHLPIQRFLWSYLG